MRARPVPTFAPGYPLYTDSAAFPRAMRFCHRLRGSGGRGPGRGRGHGRVGGRGRGKGRGVGKGVARRGEASRGLRGPGG